MSILPNLSTVCWMMFRPGHVTGDQDGSAAGPFDPLGGVLGVVTLAQVGDDNIGSLPGVRDCDGPADSAVPAGDHGDLAGQPAGADVGILPTVGHRVHPGLDTGRFLLLGRLIHRALPFGEAVGLRSTPPGRRTHQVTQDCGQER
jgi:hypothetical protein